MPTRPFMFCELHVIYQLFLLYSYFYTAQGYKSRDHLINKIIITGYLHGNDNILFILNSTI